MNNFISESISKDTAFIEFLKESIQYLYDNANMITLYDRNNKTIKGLIHKSSPDIAYFVIKEEDRYSLYSSIVYSYVLESQNTEEGILSHTLVYNGIDKTKDIGYLSATSILEYKNGRSGDFELPSDIKKMTDDDIIEFLKQCRTVYLEKITNKLSTIREYFDMCSVYDKKFNVSDEKLISYTESASISYLPKMVDIGLRLKFLNDLTQFTKEDPFEYNDMDNYIWKQDGFILLEDQNLIHICKYVDNKNFNIISILKENIPCNITNEQYIENMITNFDNISTLKFGLVSFKDGEITYIDECFYRGFELDIICGIEVMEEEHKISYLNNTNIDINSVKYMRDYVYTLYGYNRFEFCNCVFLTLGSGYDYSQSVGGYVYRGSQYREDLKTSPLECPPDGFLYGLFNDYIKISYLNDEWAKELKWFSNKISLMSSDTKTISGNHTKEEVLKSIEPFIN